MRRTLAVALISLVGPAAALAAPPASRAATPEGGARTPENGGAAYGELPPPRRESRRPRRRRSARGGPLLAAFAVTPARFYTYGSPARVEFRIDGRARAVRVRLRVARSGQKRTIATIDLGERRTGRRQRALLDGFVAGRALPQGPLELRLSARDARGRRLRTGARASAAQGLELRWHRFPLAGAFDYGGEGARFGAGRPGHSHQGQDLTAAEGTPVVAPRGGVVQQVAYQADGAGHYVILDGHGEDRDYAFMHLQSGSIAVRQGQRVRTGQLLGRVGSTGASSGPHLHFEIWEGGGWYEGGRPVDPLPYLRRWDAWS